MQISLALLLRDSQKQGYLEMYGFVRARVSLAVVRSTTLLLRGTRYKGVYIIQRPDLADGEVMALIATWKG